MKPDTPGGQGPDSVLTFKLFFAFWNFWRLFFRTKIIFVQNKQPLSKHAHLYKANVLLSCLLVLETSFLSCGKINTYIYNQ